MFLEIASNNGTKYIRVCESVRITDEKTGKSVPKKKTVKNIGPVTKFDDGKPNFIERLKASYTAGNPILDELKPYVNAKQPQEAADFGLDPNNVMKYDFEDAKANTTKYVEEVMKALGDAADDRFQTK